MPSLANPNATAPPQPATITARIVLHPAQETVARSRARFVVLAAGRRWGKSLFGVSRCVRLAAIGRRVWWVSRTYTQAGIGWRMGTAIARTLPPNLVRVREGDRALLFCGGGELWFKSGDRPDNLRGEGLDHVALDEAAFHDEDVWGQVLRPAVSDRVGTADFLSTPAEETGWFRDLFDRGRSGADSAWESFQFPSDANPKMTAAEIEQARRDMHPVDFSREFEAQFVSHKGAILRRAWIGRCEEAPPKLAVTVGVDLAISTKTSADYTAIVALGRAADGMLYVLAAERDRVGFHDAIGMIRAAADRFRPREIAVEAIAYQQAAVEELLRSTTLPVLAAAADRDKIARFAPLASRYQQGLVKHVEDLPEEFERELLAFPVGRHDDFVDALAYAYAAQRSDAAIGEVGVYDRRRGGFGRAARPTRAPATSDLSPLTISVSRARRGGNSRSSRQR